MRKKKTSVLALAWTWHASASSTIDISTFLHDSDHCTLALTNGIMRQSLVMDYHRNLARWKYLHGSDLCSVTFVMVHDRRHLTPSDRMAVFTSSDVTVCLFLQISCRQCSSLPEHGKCETVCPKTAHIKKRYTWRQPKMKSACVTCPQTCASLALHFATAPVPADGSWMVITKFLDTKHTTCTLMFPLSSVIKLQSKIRRLVTCPAHRGPWTDTYNFNIVSLHQVGTRNTENNKTLEPKSPELQ
jgi:Fe-S-cluster-containing hydrogenase component 2